MPARKVLSDSAPTKKPSLASLKPDKELNKRARSKAVKKIETHVSKKSASKKSPIIARKKTETTGLSVKRAVKRKSTKTHDPVLVLPQNMSIRAREKAFVLLEQVSKDFQKSAQQVAYTSGLCFILLGASMALAFSSSVAPQSQSALLGGATEQIGDTVTTTADQLAQTNLVPEISLLDSLPTEARSVSEHKLAVLNVKNLQIKARSLADGKIVTLSVDDLSIELYKFVIDPDKLSPGRHSIVAYAESVVDGSKHTRSLGDFLVPYPQTTQTASSSQTTTQAVEEEEEEEDDDIIATTQAVTTAVSSTTAPVVQPVVSGEPTLSVTAPAGDLIGRVLIKVEAPKDLNFIEMYVRQPKSSNSRFVGLAEKRSDNWYFFFNTVDVPNGEYEILARTRLSGKDYFSTGVRTRIANFAPPVVDTEPIEQESRSAEAVHVPLESASSSGRSLPDFTLSDVNEQESQDITIAAPVEVRDVIAQYEEEMRELFNRYAVAQQSGDLLLIEIARKELESGKEKILNDILTDQSINYLADEAEKVLEERFDILSKRVETFEELRRTASNSATSADTDKDGISDFDEKNLYNTDATLPDTDNDGIQDGVEIMRGFDPLNPDAEAVILFELPQESLALVQEETLKVERVVPVIVNHEETGKSVQAEIIGKALPNSYVTLYIFSSPTIVTVRTDENGAFSYTFEKELEDGDHEVYVAITDNTGAIVARSNPFRFVKQAEAFTPLDGNAEQVTNESFGTIASLNSYNTVVGLGILAFGLILLMLGISMREKAGVTPQDPSHDFKTS